jgi:hypothetical protein
VIFVKLIVGLVGGQMARDGVIEPTRVAVDSTGLIDSDEPSAGDA